MNNNQLLHYLLYMNLGTPAYDYENEHIAAMKSGSALPFCNRVCGTVQTNFADLITVKMFYQATPFRWFVDAQDVVLKKQLETFGLQHKVSFPAMRMSLADLLQQHNYLAEFRIEKIDHTHHDAWIKIVCASYGIPAVHQFKLFIDYLIGRAGPNQLHFFIGYYNDKPVATSLVIDHGDVIGLHWVGVVPDMRHKGLGYAISYGALRDAHTRGKEQAILLASDQGQPIYQKIGFTQYALYDVCGY